LKISSYKFPLAFLLSWFSCITATNLAQEKVTFETSDGLTVTADWYKSTHLAPFIILFHQAGYSRGEYKETAPRLVKLGYNCLAVDLRSGGKINFVKNETAMAANREGYATGYYDALPDIKAAIDFVNTITAKKVILCGSSYSASLVLLEAAGNEQVKAVIAFSPGEYFMEDKKVDENIQGIDVPMFVVSTHREYPYVKEIFADMPKDKLTIYTSKKGEGAHGSKSLWKSTPGNESLWLSLMMFINKLNR
jgi:dienelactone hydrolase